MESSEDLEEDEMKDKSNGNKTNKEDKGKKDETPEVICKIQQYKNKRDESERFVKDSNSTEEIQNSEQSKENDALSILRIMTSRLDPFDAPDHELFKNYVNIPLDIPNKDFLSPYKRQRNLSYRY